MTVAFEPEVLDKMISDCLDRLREEGYEVMGRFSETSYEYIFVAKRGKIQSSHRVTAEDQANLNYDGLFKWASTLLNPEHVKKKRLKNNP